MSKKDYFIDFRNDKSSYKMIAKRSSNGHYTIYVDDKVFIEKDKIISGGGKIIYLPNSGDTIMFIAHDRFPVMTNVLYRTEVNSEKGRKKLKEQEKKFEKSFSDIFKLNINIKCGSNLICYACLLKKVYAISLNEILKPEPMIVYERIDSIEKLEERHKRSLFSKLLFYIEATFEERSYRTEQTFGNFLAWYWSKFVPNVISKENAVIIEFNYDFSNILGVTLVNKKKSEIFAFYRRISYADWKPDLLIRTFQVIGNSKPRITLSEIERDYLSSKKILDTFKWRLKDTTEGENGRLNYIYN